MITLFCNFLCRVCTATRRKEQILSLTANGKGKSINFSMTTDLNIRRRQRQRERQKNGFNKQNNNFACAIHFFVHFFAVKNARLQRQNALFHVLWRIQKSDDDIFLLFMNMNMVYRT